MTDLKTTYLGIPLKNPLLAASSPLSKKLGDIRRLEDAGLAGIVIYSLFEEQIEHESLALNYYLERGTESFAEALTYFPEMESYNIGPDSYVELIRKAKESTGIPIIGSLNGYTPGGWIKYAKMIEQAGADALELNIYFIPSSLEQTSTELEKAFIDLVYDVGNSIHIPLAVKMGPYFTALPNLCRQLTAAGSKGLVFFNRFYQPDLDMDKMEVVPNLEWSTSSDLRLPLRWIALLYGRIKADFALSSGIHTGTDIVKALMAGAQAAMTASELLESGISRASQMLVDLENWMSRHQYESVRQMIGSMSQRSVAEPAAFERANYMKVLTSIDSEYFK